MKTTIDRQQNPEPLLARFVFFMPLAMRADLKRIAGQVGESMNQIIRSAVALAIEELHEADAEDYRQLYGPE
jgi:hypothetical protein